MKTVLLMGGKSSRMGTPKHLLQLNNKTFFELLCENLIQIAPIVISTSKEHVIECDYPIIVDQYCSIGPMNGLYSTLKTLNESILTVPCDHPLIQTHHLKQLLSFNEEGIDALVVCHQGKVFPTIGIYHPSCISSMEKMISQKNYRMMHLLESINVKYVEASTIKLSEKEMKNINTPDDYQNIKKAV